MKLNSTPLVAEKNIVCRRIFHACFVIRLEMACEINFVHICYRLLGDKMYIIVVGDDNECQWGLIITYIVRLKTLSFIFILCQCHFIFSAFCCFPILFSRFGFSHFLPIFIAAFINDFLYYHPFLLFILLLPLETISILYYFFIGPSKLQTFALKQKNEENCYPYPRWIT